MTKKEQETLESMMEYYIRMAMGVWAKFNPGCHNFSTWFYVNGKRYDATIKISNMEAEE